MADTSDTLFIRMCASKQLYRDEHAAKMAKRSYEKKRGTRLRVYRCPFCARFHLTKSAEIRT